MIAMMPMQMIALMLMRMIAGALAVCLPFLTYGLHPGERPAVKQRSLNMILNQDS